ncbi:MAG: YkgJ family cysteine cluster protein [Gammaproteobacteria bacterium]|nr:YkgJ family cysteine cluster protein [Gammaproteobacteria bacterium]
MECRIGCGACCIAPTINAPLPGMPNGKPAMIRCIHLSDENQCRIFESPDRPDFCARFKAEPSICGDTMDDAIERIKWLDEETNN